MRCVVLFCLSAIPIAAQSTSRPIIGSSAYSFPVPLAVAPGQLITIFVHGVNTDLTGPVRASGTPLPAVLAGVSLTYHQGNDQSAGMVEVRPISTCFGIPPPSGTACGTMLAVTAQLPFQMLTLCPLCARVDIPASLAVTVNGVVGLSVSVQPLNDQVHFLTACDVIIPGSQPRISTTLLPCAPMVTHADGKLVSAASPAKAGEELAAYATGLGQTDPPLKLGEPASSAAPAVTLFAIDFNFHINALAAKPAGLQWFNTAGPSFAGSTPGYAGLYQVNFVVPSPPSGLPACIDANSIPPFTNAIISNLIVSVGSAFSFDGFGICVQPEG